MVTSGSRSHKPQRSSVLGEIIWIHCCAFETDSNWLEDVHNGNPGRSYFHSTIGDCVELFKHFENVLVCIVPRSANEVAHLLAKVSRSMSDFQKWEDVAPNLLLCFDLRQVSYIFLKKKLSACLFIVSAYM